ncbi:MAG: hypothetical protein U0804_09715 [Gemmataceae bacterium]
MPQTRSVLGCLLLIGCLFVASLVAVVLAAVVTKPSEAAMHREVVGDRPEAVLFAGVAEAAGLVTVTYPDYVVYRTMQVKVAGMPPRTVAVGFFGQVVRVDEQRPVGPPPGGPRPAPAGAPPPPGPLTKVPDVKPAEPAHWVSGGLTPFALSKGYYVVLDNTTAVPLEDVTVEYSAPDGRTRVQAVGSLRPGEQRRVDPSPWVIEPGQSFLVRARGRDGIRFPVNLPKK